MCHGIQGDGDGFLAEGLDPKPRDFTNYKVMAHIPDQSISDAVRHGISGTAMPSFDLSDNQIADVTAYVRSFTADSYLTVNACLMDKQSVKTNMNLARIKVKTDDPNLIDVKKKGSNIIISPKALNIQRKQSNHSRVTRTHIRLIKDDGDSERNVSLIAVRLHDCIR